jgi:uncharacterized membrane protein YidH (DUF202 family)
VSQPSGAGLAEERTAFAWRRTAVSVAVGALICLKVLPPQLGMAGWVVAVLGLCWSADLSWVAWRRQHGARAPSESGAAASPWGAGHVARTAAVTFVVGVVAMVAAVVIASRAAGA